jgi:hypothetical protein
MNKIYERGGKDEMNIIKKEVWRKKIKNNLKKYEDAKLAELTVDEKIEEYSGFIDDIKEDIAELDRDISNIVAKIAKTDDQSNKEKLREQRDKLREKKAEYREHSKEIIADSNIAKERKSQLIERTKQILKRAQERANESGLTKFFEDLKYIIDTNILNKKQAIISDPSEKEKIKNQLKERVEKIKAKEAAERAKETENKEKVTA